MNASNILVVEDEFIIAKDIETSLENMGYRVCGIVSSGEEAIATTEKEKPDLVLMDIILKGAIDGIEAARQIQSQFKIPIVYLTAHADEKTLEKAKITESYGYITKPFNERALNIAIQIALYKHKMEKKLRKSEEKFRFLAEHSADTIYKVNLESELYTYASPSIEKLFGYTPEEVLSLKVNDTLTAESYGKQREQLINALVDGRKNPEIIEVEVVHKDGHILPVEIHANFIADERGNSIEILGIARDITERKKTEEQLKQAKNMELVGTLAGGIAHDYNNLLAAIMGNLSMAQMETEPRSDMAEFLREAEKASLKARDLTHQFLILSQGGHPMKLLGSIESLLKEIPAQVEARESIEYIFSIQDDLWPVEYDSRQMHCVISNLFLNAIEAMPQGGCIDIQAVNRVIENNGKNSTLPLKDGKYVRISIKDKGRGISEKHLHRVFDPYFSTKDRGTQKGMGLGLAVASAIVQKHDGHIMVESSIGVGTTVTIYLPACDC